MPFTNKERRALETEVCKAVTSLIIGSDDGGDDSLWGEGTVVGAVVQAADMVAAVKRYGRRGAATVTAVYVLIVRTF